MAPGAGVARWETRGLQQPERRLKIALQGSFPAPAPRLGPLLLLTRVPAKVFPAALIKLMFDPSTQPRCLAALLGSSAPPPITFQGLLASAHPAHTSSKQPIPIAPPTPDISHLDCHLPSWQTRCCRCDPALHPVRRDRSKGTHKVLRYFVQQ